jgi:hypothetical protein
VYQFMPDTAKGYGIDALDTSQASKAAGKMLRSLYEKYGSWDKAIAAYNWGPGNLDADIKKHGADWLKYAPAETQGEVDNVVGRSSGAYDSAVAKALERHSRALRQNTMAKNKPAHVSITNSTSARVAVSANALAVT